MQNGVLLDESFDLSKLAPAPKAHVAGSRSMAQGWIYPIDWPDSPRNRGMLPIDMGEAGNRARTFRDSKRFRRA